MDADLIESLLTAHPAGVTEDEALNRASVYACIVLLKNGLSLTPGSHADISTDNGDGTASITFTWKRAYSPPAVLQPRLRA